MKQLLVIGLLAVLCLCGCEGFRYAATEAQRENAWLHSRVCAAAAETAVDESASEALCGLTDLANAQSEAFVMDYGFPQTLPAMNDVVIRLVHIAHQLKHGLLVHIEHSHNPDHFLVMGSLGLFKEFNCWNLFPVALIGPALQLFYRYFAEAVAWFRVIPLRH